MDFKQSWQNQKAFWTSVLENCPDLEDETVILVICRNLPTTKFIKTNSWSDSIVLKQIYQFPRAWQQEPRLFLAYPRLWTQVGLEPTRSQWWIPSLTWPGYVEVPLKANVILLRPDGRKLTRIDKPVVIQGKTFAERRTVSATHKWRESVLYKYLITQRD